MSRTIDWSNFPSKANQRLRKREKGFILDAIAVDTIGSGYEKMLPKVWSVIPPYNSQRDPFLGDYFRKPFVRDLLKKTEQSHGGTSSSGWVVDYFHIYGPGQKYLNRRNWIGAGHSSEQVGGHSNFLSEVHPIAGYNGRYGYRRNTTPLRQKPSSFGVVTPFSLY
ncbi:sperm microtubule associated protein 1 [Ambystoma mexicanum]|uniref:sperm microtubule associated protein 1 n=1 Tax=Ambystoma mexicanum TaxID=8296 RepID=UPI0037E743CE